MYKVIFKGSVEPVVISMAAGDQLKAKLDRGDTTGYIDVAGSYVQVNTIKAVVPNDDSDTQGRREELTEQIAQADAEFKAWRQSRLKMSAKERAQSVAFFNYLCQALRGRPLTNKEKDDVRSAQEKWFTEHPDFHAANPVCYFSKDELSMEEEHLPMKGVLRLAKINALNYAERHLNAY